MSFETRIRFVNNEGISVEKGIQSKIYLSTKDGKDLPVQVLFRTRYITDNNICSVFNVSNGTSMLVDYTGELPVKHVVYSDEHDFFTKFLVESLGGVVVRDEFFLGKEGIFATLNWSSVFDERDIKRIEEDIYSRIETIQSEVSFWLHEDAEEININGLVYIFLSDLVYEINNLGLVNNIGIDFDDGHIVIEVDEKDKLISAIKRFTDTGMPYSVEWLDISEDNEAVLVTISNRIKLGTNWEEAISEAIDSEL